MSRATPRQRKRRGRRNLARTALLLQLWAGLLGRQTAGPLRQWIRRTLSLQLNGWWLKVRDHSVLRAEIVAYQRKHAATFEAWWDRADSSGNELADFPAYLAHMQGNGVWAGPLEIESAARAYNIEIFVVPRDGNLPPVVHNQGGPFRVALWFTGQHFDWLRPSAKDQGFPSAITNICSAPDMRSARGGGPEDAASVADSAWTIWTRDSQDRPVPLPKRPKAQPRPPISPPNGGSGRGPNSGQNSVGPDPHSRAGGEMRCNVPLPSCEAVSLREPVLSRAAFWSPQLHSPLL